MLFLLEARLSWEGQIAIRQLEPTEADGLDSYVSVDDDALLDCLYSIFKERFSDESVFVD